MLRIFLAAFFLTLLLQEISLANPDSLSLSQCIDRAVHTNANARIAQAQLRGAKVHRDALEATRNLAVSARSHLLWAPANGYDTVVTNSGQFAAQIAAQLPVYDGGIRSLSIDQASVDIDRAEGEQRLTANDLALQTSIAFYTLSLEQRERMLIERSVSQLAEYLDLTHRLQQGGVAEETDILKTEIQLTASKVALRDNAQRIHEAANALAFAMGVPVAPDIRDTVTIDSTYVPDSLHAATLDEHVAQLGVSHATFDMSLAQAERHPTLFLSADAGALTSFANIRNQSGLHNVFGYSAYAEFQMPIWNGGLSDRHVEEQQAVVDALQARNEALHATIAAAWSTAREEYLAAKETMARVMETLHAAETNYSLSVSKFGGGRGSSLEVLDAQRQMTDTSIDLEKARTRMLIARATLERLMIQ